jgi:hypothetical protein
MRRVLLGAVCAALIGLSATPARAAFDDPLFFYVPQPSDSVPAPPVGYVSAPCGLAVGASGGLYVSDYYHRAVDIFGVTSNPSYASQPLTAWSGAANPHTGPVDDPCGLSLGPSGVLYLNNYHRNVVRFPVPLSLASAQVIDSGDPSDPFANPTGVAVDAGTGRLYVDDRAYVAVYDASGNPVLDGSDPLRIGEDTLGDGYGIAVSGYPITPGYVYVPDAATDTVKVYDPATSTTIPAQTITGPPGGFGSLEDSAVAVDDDTGEVYVVDTLGAQLSEEPWAVVWVFNAAGAYKGRLKYATVNAAPTGIAVDNTGTSTQGRVYVTSGIGEHAGIYGYPPDAVTSAALPPLKAGTGGGGSSLSAGVTGPSSSTTTPLGQASSREGPRPHRASSSSISQKGNLRVSVGGELRPRRLPRKGAAPIAVSVSGEISTTDQSLPPSLKTLRIDLNRYGRIDSEGLPVCPYERIQPGTSSHALSTCRSSLVGKGSFTADITLSGQEPYPTKGKLLVFNGLRGGKPVLYGHIYSPRPFATSFVIVFAVKKLGKGTYGSSLIAPLPAAMKVWGRLTGISMTLSRRYSYKGHQHSYLSSGCPAPKGFSKAAFPLARASFAFEGGQSLSSVLNGTCKVGG